MVMLVTDCICRKDVDSVEGKGGRYLELHCVSIPNFDIVAFQHCMNSIQYNDLGFAPAER
jgi:hypothetical protein